VRAAVVAGRMATPPPPEVDAVDLITLAGSQEAATREAARWLAVAGRQLAADAGRTALN
jgi:hypothetical protein